MTKAEKAEKDYSETCNQSENHDCSKIHQV